MGMAMKRLCGFQLDLIADVKDFYSEDICSQSSLKVITENFSANDSPVFTRGIQNFSEGQSCFRIFIPLSQAADPLVWERIVAWAKSGTGRSLRLRYENSGKDSVELEKVVRLLELVLKELRSSRGKLAMKKH